MSFSFPTGAKRETLALQIARMVNLNVEAELRGSLLTRRRAIREEYEAQWEPLRAEFVAKSAALDVKCEAGHGSIWKKYATGWTLTPQEHRAQRVLVYPKNGGAIKWTPAQAKVEAKIRAHYDEHNVKCAALKARTEIKHAPIWAKYAGALAAIYDEHNARRVLNPAI